MASSTDTTTLEPAVAAALANQTNTTAGEKERKGITFEKWPFRLDIDTEYQDWILCAVCFVLFMLWCMPCICGAMRNPMSRAFTKSVYTRLNCFFWVVTYFNLVVLMFTIGILPDWTVNEFVEYLVNFIAWILQHLEKIITSAAILLGFYLLFKFKERIAMAAGLEHLTLFRWNWKDMLGISVKKRPVEVFIWKVEDLSSHMVKVYKANDIFVECHLGDNEPMRTRVHNNAGTSCMIKESFQMNINENDSTTMMTLLVKDQGLLAGSELARLMLSIREVCGIEDQTGKRRTDFVYSTEHFVELKLLPRGTIWLAIAPVDDLDEEKAPLMNDDSLVTC